MKKEQIIAKLEHEGIHLIREKQIEHGINMYFSNDSNVAFYTKSERYVPGGKNKQQTLLILESDNVGSDNDIFIVYGHDETARNELELILRRWGMNPIILSQQAPNGRTLIETLEAYLNRVKYGIVLATPDDIGYPKNSEQQKKYRARQNVIFELGMLFSKLGREKVSILVKKTKDLDMEKPSDIGGLIYLEYIDSVDECKDKLMNSLKKNGYNISN